METQHGHITLWKTDTMPVWTIPTTPFGPDAICLGGLQVKETNFINFCKPITPTIYKHVYLSTSVIMGKLLSPTLSESSGS
jgi:hypothetical protein